MRSVLASLALVVTACGRGDAGGRGDPASPPDDGAGMIPSFGFADLVVEAVRAQLPPGDPEARDRVAISFAVRAGAFAEVAQAIATAPLPERPHLAYRAAALAPADQLAALSNAAREPELSTAVADRLEQERGPAAALDPRMHAAALAPDRAEPYDALARVMLATGDPGEAVLAWDHAAAIAPAQPAYRLAAIRALASATQESAHTAARERVTAWAAAARAKADIDELLAASTAAQAIADHPLAIALARDARALRPTDGRLAFELAARHAAAREIAPAAALYTELLACGAHGHPWHRHEVAAQLVALATDAASAQLVLAALAAPQTCEVPDRADLDGYVAGIRTKLAQPRRQ